MNSNNAKNIGKNTIYLYIQKFISLAIALYSSRLLIKALGIDDFGLYGLLGSIVVMFNSIRTLFSSSIQRFINISKKNNSKSELSQIFSMGIMINTGMAVILFIILEIAGLILLPKLDIPSDSINAAYWVLQCSIVSAILNILTVPYDAVLIANENFKFFSIFSLLDIGLKLCAVFTLFLFSTNRIIIYSVLLLFISLIIRIIDALYCKSKYKDDIKFQWKWNQSLFKKMSGFAGWNFLGNTGYSLTNEGVNVILNLFGGVIVNSARTITYQVFGAIKQLTTDTTMSFQPRTMRLFAEGEYDKVMQISIFGSKINYGFALFIVTLLSIFLKPIIQIWLGEIPPHVIAFIYSIFPYILIRSVHPFIDTLFKASGKMRVYQTIEFFVMLLNLPVSWILLKLKFPFYSVFIAMGIIEIINLSLILVFSKKVLNFNAQRYVTQIYPHILLSSSINFVIFAIFANICQNCIIWQDILICLLLIPLCCFTILFSMFTNNERLQLKSFCFSILQKFRHKAIQ